MPGQNELNKITDDAQGIRRQSVLI